MLLSPQNIAIPLFASTIAIEAFIIIRNSDTYDKKDALNNIFIGIMSVFFGFVFALATTQIYDVVYYAAPFTMPMNVWWSWAILFILDDFAYYWFHRISHECRFMWNFHVVHHSSNFYNLSVAVRQSWFSGVAHWVFFLSAAIVGFPFWAFAVIHGFNLIYQFWIHTELIDKLPRPLEFILNTPSHHRVHHGTNKNYLDKNYGGIFIFWDRLFGTFEPETEKPEYGITNRLEGYNPLWANLHGWTEMFAAMRQRNTLYGKLRCIFGAPDMNFEEESALRLKPN
ncbi:MAG: sterol desaturase family protein [Pyrinomonadaceae bacterium]